MYPSILVPLDGTAFGERALAPAAEIASRFGATLHLVHVLSMVGEGPTPDYPEQVEIMFADAQRYLAGAESTASAKGAPSVLTHLRRGGVARELAKAARELKASLVVLSTHGRTNGKRLLHSCVAAAVTRRVDVPVVMVRQPVPATSEGGPRFRHVLLPLSGASSAEQVVEPACGLGEPFAAKYTLLRVAPAVSGRARSGRGEAQAYLSRIARRLTRRGAAVDMVVVTDQDPAGAIVRFIKRHASGECPVDVVAMATHGFGGPSHLLRPGTSASVVHGSPIPVFLWRSRSMPRRVAARVRRIGAELLGTA